MNNNNMNNNNCLIMGEKKKVKKTRNRKPVAPKFDLPPRGYRCINWLPIGKREIKKRVQDLGRHRLQVVELAINNTITHLFEYFNQSSSLNVFKLDYDSILNDLTSEWDDKLLNDWNGPKLKSTTWEKKLWEGKNGYWKLCKNWADQNKYQVSHIFWCKVYTQIMIFIKLIASTQYPDNKLLYNQFLNCLKYACLYSIFAAKIGFPKTRLLPLLVNTVIAKNKDLKRYLQKEYDPELDIYKWKEQESMKYDEINNAATKDNKVCAAVKERCIEYSADKMQCVFNEFYQSINSMIPSTILDRNKYNVSIEFDASGNITHKKRIQTTAKPKPKKTKSCKTSSSRSSSLMEQNAPNCNNLMDDIKSNESPSISNGNATTTYGTYCPYDYDDDQPSPPTLPPVPPPVSIPVPVPMNNHSHNNLVDPLYGAIHGQSTRVMNNRANPIMSLHRRQSFSDINPNMYGDNMIPSNLRRNRSDISNLSSLNSRTSLNYNRLNDSNINQFDPNHRMNTSSSTSTSTSPSQAQLDELQQTNQELRQQIAECQAMLAQTIGRIASAGSMGINHVNINGSFNDNMDYQMSNMDNNISVNNTNDYNMISRDVQRPLHNFRNYSQPQQIPPYVQSQINQQSPPSHSHSHSHSHSLSHSYSQSGSQWIAPSQSLQPMQSMSSAHSIPSSESSSTISHGSQSIGVLGDMSNMNRNNNNNGSNIMTANHSIYNQMSNYGHINMNNNNIDGGPQQQASTNMTFTISDANSTPNVSYSRGPSVPPYSNIFPDTASVFSRQGFDMNQSTIHAPSYTDAPAFI